MIEQRPDEIGSPYYEKCLAIKDSISGEIYDHNKEFSGFRLLISPTRPSSKMPWLVSRKGVSPST